MTLFESPQEGWRSESCTTDAIDWAAEHARARNAYWLSCNDPLELAPFQKQHWPVFLIGLHSQDFGRKELLRRIDLSPSTEAAADWLGAHGGGPRRSAGTARTRDAALAATRLVRSTCSPHRRAQCGRPTCPGKLCASDLQRCAAPQAGMIEYARRDAANIVLDNMDNHARNTVLQRDFNGHIRLTPLYDFAPMYWYPNDVARRTR